MTPPGRDEHNRQAAAQRLSHRARRERRLVSLARPILAPLASWLFRALAATWRIRFEGPNPFASPSPRPQLGALWHRNVLAAAGIFRGSGIHVPVSLSRDGEHIATLLPHLGLAVPPRGSSNRGAVGLLRSMARLVECGETIAIPTDGPLGPAGVSKPGVISLARLTRQPIVPVAISARPCLRFGSWDRMLLPLPFARVVCRYGEAMPVEGASSRERREALRAALDTRLEEMTEALDGELGLAR
jgi:lysophospholipid acyltransferase (LPLAT)-like uncharacterized protein